MTRPVAEVVSLTPIVKMPPPPLVPVAACLLPTRVAWTGASYFDDEEIFTSASRSNISVAYRSPSQVTFTLRKVGFEAERQI